MKHLFRVSLLDPAGRQHVFNVVVSDCDRAIAKARELLGSPNAPLASIVNSTITDGGIHHVDPD